MPDSEEAERSAGGGLTVLDGAALVAGAAVAAVHVRGVTGTEPMGPGWVIVWGSFFWVALTAAGPFLFMVRKFARGLDRYPGVGDWLWAMLGLPWVFTALMLNPPAPEKDLLAMVLSIGLGLASAVAVAVVWSTWVMVSPERASQTFSGPWTNRVGLVLAVAWPIQCGVGLVVIG
jgi:hypothetical protein